MWNLLLPPQLLTTPATSRQTFDHLLFACRYKPAPEDQILKAFQTLDTEGKGYLTNEELTKWMTEEGTLNGFIMSDRHYFHCTGQPKPFGFKLEQKVF